MGDLLRRIKTALGLTGRAGPTEEASDHQAVLDRLAEQKQRLAALDAGMPRRPETRGFRF